MTKQIKGDDFQAEVIESTDTVLVDFFAEWCGPCQGMAPVLDELEADLTDGHKVVKIDIDEAPEIAAKYGVMSIPTFKVFKGGEIINEAMGTKSKGELLAMMS